MLAGWGRKPVMGQTNRAGLAVLILSICAGTFANLAAANAPYVIVTADGQRLEVLDIPRNTDKTTKFRSYPDGRLSSFPSARIDWKATDAANAAPAAPAIPTPPPTPVGAGPRLSALAGTLDVDGGRGNTAGDTMKLKSGKAANMYDQGPFFGEKSVMSYLGIGALVFSAAGCPVERAVFAGSVTNKSKKKLRDLRGLVLLVERGTNRTVERMESFDPPNLAPGEEAQIFLYVSCDSAVLPSAKAYQNYAAVLRDVSGTAEELQKPGQESPFAPSPVPGRK
jgi:hypothetical protein